MNCEVYVFGKLSSGYTQYPEDTSSQIFQNIHTKVKAPSQLIIHRDEALMYYIYLRFLDADKYIGLAIQINNYYFTSPLELFPLFEKEIERLVEKGVILNFNSNAVITSNLVRMNDEEEEVLTSLEEFKRVINTIGGVKKLPTVNYGFSIHSQKIFSIEENNEDITKATYNYGSVIILKERDYDTVRVNSFRSIIRNLNADIKKLVKETQELKEQNLKIKREKKQFTKLVWLIVFLIIAGIGAYILYLNLNQTKDLLYDANKSINLKNAQIEEDTQRIAVLQDSVADLSNLYSNTVEENKKLEKALETINKNMPFVITNIDVSSTNVTFDYYAYETRDLDITLKAVNESTSSVYSNSHNLTFYKGGGHKTLYFDRTLNSSYYYYIVIMYNGKIIGGKRW